MKVNFKWELRDLGIVIALLFLALVIVYGLYTPFCLDDYEYAYLLKTHGFFGAIQERYMHWHGRFSSNFLILLYHALGNIPRGFNFSALINTLFLISILSLFQTRLIRLAGMKKKILGILILAVFAIAASPFLHSLLLWWTGSATYLAGFFFAILSLWLSDRLIRKTSMINWPLHFIFVMIAAGMNETNFIFLILGNIYIWWNYYKKVDDTRWRQTALYNVFCLSTAALAVLMSPGQMLQNESIKLVGQHNIQTSFFGILNIPYYSDYHLIHFALIILGTFCYLCLNPRLRLKVTAGQIIALGLTVALAFISIHFATYWNQGLTFFPATVPPRISNILLLLIFLFTVLLAVKIFQETKKSWKNFNPPQWANSLVLIFLLLTAVYQGNGKNIIDGLFRQTPQTIFYLEKAMHERISVSGNSKLHLTLPTKLITDRKPLYPLGLVYQSNPNYWYNKLLCKYYSCSQLSFSFADDSLWLEVLQTHAPEYFTDGHYQGFQMSNQPF